MAAEEKLPAIQIETLLSVFKEVPQVKELTEKLDKASKACVTILSEMEKATNDEEFEENNASLVTVREQYGKIKALRENITRQTDELKDFLMQFERPLDTTKKDNLYGKARSLQEQYQQEKIDRQRAEQEKLAKRKEHDNLKVDLKARIQENLVNNRAETVKKADLYASEYFKTLELSNFDEMAERFKRQNPKLSLDSYNKCFVCPDDLMAKAKELFQPSEFSELVAEIQKDEPYDKWNELVKEAVAPVMNQWRAKIPDLKKELEDIAKASAAEAQRLKEEREKREAEALRLRNEAADKAAEEKKQEVQSDASMERMSNEFAAQAGAQSLEDTGPTKLVLKFLDYKTTPKAFLAILYHCFSHKDFPGIQRRDAKKNLMVDDKGRPVYIEPVQWWIDWFLDNCDAEVEGTKVTKDAKIIVRK